MPVHTVNQLLELFFLGEISPEEKILLAKWIEQPENEEELSRLLFEKWEMFETNNAIPARQSDEMLSKILEKAKEIEKAKPVKPGLLKRIEWKKFAVAASILFLIITSVWYWKSSSVNNKDALDLASKDIDAPTSTKAMITLADGSKVYLDSISNGTLLMDDGVTVIKHADGKISYQTTNGEELKVLKYNTLTNTKGSRPIDLILSDGSHVWLNSASSLTYPVRFIGNERKISITGEAYIEVAHNSKMPFYVTKAGMTVEVIGTKFNINAYDDEDDIKVTLLQGSIKVSDGISNKIIKPGQQALVASGIKVLSNINMDAVMAWQKEQFVFSGLDAKTLMRQVARWYDVEVVFERDVSGVKLGGSVSRDISLSTLIAALKKYNIHCKLSGDKIIVE